MGTIWQNITWDTARAGGFTAYVLLTLAVAAGLALSLQLQSPSFWPRIINNELHNFLTLIALIFTGVHVLAVFVDPFTNFGLGDVLIPLASYYRPIWMAFGIVALYLGLALAASVWLRPKIGYAWWRRLHIFTLLVYALVTLHGIATGSDTQTWWGLVIYGSSVLLVGGLLLRQLLIPLNARSRSHPVLASLLALLILIGVIWTATNPLRSGWSVAAGGAPASGARSTSQGTVGSDPFASAFSATLQGTVTQNGPDAGGAETIQMNTTLSNGAQGVLTITLQGQQQGDDGGLSVNTTGVTLGTDAVTPLYQGPLATVRNGEGRWRMTANLTRTNSSTQLQVRITLQVDSSGQASGQIQSTPA